MQVFGRVIPTDGDGGEDQRGDDGGRAARRRAACSARRRRWRRWVRRRGCRSWRTSRRSWRRRLCCHCETRSVEAISRGLLRPIGLAMTKGKRSMATETATDGNAVHWFVDRHVRGRPRRRAGVPRSVAFADLRRPGARHAPLRRGAARGRHRPRAPHGDAAAGHGRFPHRLLGRAARRRGAGADQHAADARDGRLHPGGQPRRGAGDFRPAGRAAAAGAAQPAGAAPHHRRPARRQRGRADRRPARHRLRRFPRHRRTRCADRRRIAGRGGVLAVFVRLDRRAEGRAARARQPAPHRRYLRRAGAAGSAATT